MSTKPKVKIPRGWRRLRQGTILQKGDMYSEWTHFERVLGEPLEYGETRDWVAIRRIRRARASK